MEGSYLRFLKLNIEMNFKSQNYVLLSELKIFVHKNKHLALLWTNHSNRHTIPKPFIVKNIPFFLSSGFPFFTVARNMSPVAADGILFNLAPKPCTAIRYRFLAPVLSAQFMVAATGKPREILNLDPADPPRPLLDMATKE